MADPVIQQAVIRNAFILGVFAILTAGLLAFTNDSTRHRIGCNQQQALAASLEAVMPEGQDANHLLDDFTQVQDPLLGRGQHHIYRARQSLQDGALKNAGAVLEATAPDGYGGAIRLLIGVDSTGTISGVRVVPPHNETPGLGDAIEIRKSDWILSFNNRSLANTETQQWAVKKDGGRFDSFTGATITPRAVVGAVHRALQFYQQNRDMIFSAQSNTAETNTWESCDD